MTVCKPVRRLYYKESTGYTVMIYETEEEIPTQAICDQEGIRNYFKAVGRQLPDTKELVVELDGKWISSEYGWQLQVENFEVFLPKSREGIEGYLSSGLIRGVGPVLAGRIVDRFGERTFDIIQKEPEKLLEVKGITPKKLEEIRTSFWESGRIRELMTYLAPFGITPGRVSKIQEHFGFKALEVLKEKPYRLTEISGMGFLTVDPVVRRIHALADNDPLRICAAVRHVLKMAEKEGHLYLEAKEIVQRCMSLFANMGSDVSPEEIRRAGNRMVLKEGSLLADGSNIYLKGHLLEEKSVAQDIRRLVEEGCAGIETEGLLDEVQKKGGVCLGKKQGDAVLNAFRHPVSVITGGPGRGKTTVLKAILEIFRIVFPQKDALLCAPTGRAARKMMESTGHVAMTIHRALYLSEDEPEPTDIEPIQEDLVIVDEATMVDMKLAATLFSRLKSGCRLILVGDADQLPSVGPGNVFRELIDSGRLPVTVLDKSYRQQGDSLIITNADLINAGSTRLQFGRDFSFAHADSPKEAADIILRLCGDMIKDLGDPDAVQVLSPVKKQPFVGVEALNQALQELLNPDRGGSRMEDGNRVFRIRDKVMQTKNQGEISNGDIGVVEDIWLSKENGKEMSVRYPDGRIQNYGKEDLGMLNHAYAITVHKSQGSEYPVVILPVLPSFYKMLRRNVLYTAVTRASKKVCLVGSTSSLIHAIYRNDVGKRNTRLAERIRREPWEEKDIPAA